MELTLNTFIFCINKTTFVVSIKTFTIKVSISVAFSRILETIYGIRREVATWHLKLSHPKHSKALFCENIPS